MRKDTQLARIAYHEAGHAVANWKLRFKIKRVTIVPNDRWQGAVITKGLRMRELESGNPTGRQLGYYHDMVVVRFAGLEAQWRFDPRTARRCAASGDYLKATVMLLCLHGRGPDDDGKEYILAFRYLRARAKNLVNDPTSWRLIQDLAKALLERRTLTGEEVTEVLQASIKA